MTHYLEASLPSLISTASDLIQEVQADFGELSTLRLNWKPAPDRWSVGQCIEHLVTANESYFPALDRVLSGQRACSFWGRLPWLPGLWGKLLIRGVSPEGARKMKAPKIIQPTTGDVDGAIVQRFVEVQSEVIRRMQALHDQGLEAKIVSSPITDLITYSALDACRVMVAHEQRHLAQARRVSAMEGFPA